MTKVEVLEALENIDIFNYALKILIIGIGIFYTAIKITNEEKDKGNKIIPIGIIIAMTILCGVIRKYFESLSSTICLISLLIITYSVYTHSKIGYSIVIIMISSAINYSLFFIAAAMSFIISITINIKEKILILIIISVIYIFLLKVFFGIRKFKNGLAFLKSKIKDEYIELLVLNISVTLLFAIIIFAKSNIKLARSLIIGFIILTIIMFITIQKSLQLYYKQKLLVQELNETKSELEKKTKEIEELEKENLSFSKKSHTLAHKQKSLEYKLQEILNKTEISKEEAGEVKDRLKEIEKDLYKEKTTIELDKTGISQIDDMLKYMQSECTKNKIDFELQLNGNIHYMTNNLISKEDLETLLADHIKNAIIAINHTDNINRSILVRLGKIDEIYGLYIYDSGIEFEKQTLENLGNKPSTTHADEGGTGMGFMNTFDTLRKCNASLMIEEYNEPSKDNYTKVIMIKFDNKNKFKIMTYCENCLSYPQKMI